MEMEDLLLSLNTTNQFKKTKNKEEEIKRKKEGKRAKETKIKSNNKENELQDAKIIVRIKKWN